MKGLKYLLLAATVLMFACKKDNSAKTVADFTLESTGNAVPVTVQFTNKSTNATSYLWKFGDGESSVSESPTHTYTSAGDFTIVLFAYGAGDRDSASYTLTLYDSTITAGFNVANTTSDTLLNLRTFYLDWNTYYVYDVVEHGDLLPDSTTSDYSTYYPSVEVLWQQGDYYYLLAYPNSIVTGDTTSIIVYPGAGVYTYTSDPLSTDTTSSKSAGPNILNIHDKSISTNWSKGFFK